MGTVGGKEDGVGEVLEIQETLVSFESEFEKVTVVYYEESKEVGVNRGGKEGGTCAVHGEKLVFWVLFFDVVFLREGFISGRRGFMKSL